MRRTLSKISHVREFAVYCTHTHTHTHTHRERERERERERMARVMKDADIERVLVAVCTVQVQVQLVSTVMSSSPGAAAARGPVAGGRAGLSEYTAQRLAELRARRAEAESTDVTCSSKPALAPRPSTTITSTTTTTTTSTTWSSPARTATDNSVRLSAVNHNTVSSAAERLNSHAGELVTNTSSTTAGSNSHGGYTTHRTDATPALSQASSSPRHHYQPHQQSHSALQQQQQQQQPVTAGCSWSSHRHELTSAVDTNTPAHQVSLTHHSLDLTSAELHFTNQRLCLSVCLSVSVSLSLSLSIYLSIYLCVCVSSG